MATATVITFTDIESGSFNVNAFSTNGLIHPTSMTLDSTAVAADTSLLIYGKGSPNYGERTSENLVHLLENFSGTTEPNNPISGQQWFERNIYLKTSTGYWVWDGATWNSIPAGVAAGQVTEQAAVPIPTIVDSAFWYDTTNSLFYRGITDTTHPLAPTWLRRKLEDLTAEAITDPNVAGYLPNLIMRVYDGVQWKNTGAVFTSPYEPQNPSEGDMWYETTSGQLRVRVNGIWREAGDGYVEKIGDTMSGVLQFGTSLFLWEGSGNVASAPDIRMGGDGLFTAGSSLYIHIDDNNSATGTFEVAKGTQARTGGQVSLFQVLNDGQIRAGVTPYAALAGLDPNNLVNRQYVNDEDANTAATAAAALALTDAQVATNTANIVTNTADILGKINKAGDTMTGFLTANADPVLNFHYATKQYVDNGDLGGGGTDGVVTSVQWTGSTRDLQIDTSAPSVFNTSLLHDHPASEVNLIAPISRVYRDFFVPIGNPGPDYDLQNVSDTVFQEFWERLEFNNAPLVREVIVVSGTPTQLSFTALEYEAGTFALEVFVNGVKAYADERAWQSIEMDSAFQLTFTSPTGFGLADATVYELDIAVDGGVIQTMSAAGSALQTIQDIIDQINTDITGVVAIWDPIVRAIRVYSDAQGTGSEIDITDGSTNGLLAALAAVTPGAELPIYPGGIFPPSGGAITQITQDLGYFEATGAFATAPFGTNQSTIEFNAALANGDVVEVINRLNRKNF